MESTPRYGIKYPSPTDLTSGASEQFRQMGESIEDVLVTFPETITDTVTDAANKAVAASEEAEQFAAQGGAMQDAAVASLLRDPSSETRGALDGRTALFIGDSYTEGFRATSTSKRWSTVLSAMAGWQEYNYAVGGTGFVQGSTSGQTFIKQAQTAIAAGITPDVIFVAGGRNDGSSSVTAAATTLFTLLKTTFPAARIITIPIMWDCKPVTMDATWRARDIQTAARNTGVECLWDAWTWLYGRTDLTFDLGNGNYDMHPNDSGYEEIARYVYQGLNGGKTTVDKPRRQLPSLNTSVPDTGAFEVVNGIVHVSGQVRTNTNIYAGYNFSTLPPDCRPATTRYFMGFTGGGGTTVLIGISADTGEMIVNNIYGTAGKNVTIFDASWPIGR